MNKSKRAPAPDALKRFDKPASLQMTRDVEDATAAYYLEHKLNPRAQKTNKVQFVDLLPTLQRMHKRWRGLQKEDVVINKRAALKTLWQTFSRLKQNPAKLQAMVENQQAHPDSDEEAEASAPEDGGDDGGQVEGEVHQEGGGEEEAEAEQEESVYSSVSEEGPNEVSRDIKADGRCGGKHARDCKWGAADVALWTGIGRVVKRMRCATWEVADSYGKLDVLLRGLPLRADIIDVPRQAEQIAEAEDSD